MRFRGGLAGLLLLLSGVPALGQTGVALNCFDSSVAPPWKPCSSTNPLYVNISGGSLTVTSDATATAAAPSYSEGTANPLSQTLAGNLRTTGVGGSFPITAASGAIASGAVASGAIASGAVASGAYASGALASGSIASGAMVDLVASQTPIAAGSATATKGLLLGGQYDSTQKTLTAGQQAAISVSARGAIYVATGADAFTVTGAGGTFPMTLASGAVASGAYASGSIASGALASGAMVDLVALSAPVSPATATATKSILLGTQATTGAVNPTNGQQSALSSDINNNLLVSAGGAPTLATSQASITTGNISAASARALRRAITITNVTGTSAIYCGNTGVTTSTGTYLGATAGSSITLNTTAAVFCTVAATTQTVTVAETY